MNTLRNFAKFVLLVFSRDLNRRPGPPSSLGGCAKCKGGSARQWCRSYPINPKGGSGALGYPFYARHPVEGPKPPRFPTYRPTRSKLTNSAPVLNAGRRTVVNLKPLLRLRKRSTFLAIFIVLIL